MPKPRKRLPPAPLMNEQIIQERSYRHDTLNVHVWFTQESRQHNKVRNIIHVRDLIFWDKLTHMGTKRPTEGSVGNIDCLGMHQYLLPPLDLILLYTLRQQNYWSKLVGWVGEFYITTLIRLFNLMFIIIIALCLCLYLTTWVNFGHSYLSMKALTQ